MNTRMSNVKSQIPNPKSQGGQIVIVLLLAMLVALSVGLVVTQRSITDVTTSTQTDQATRAYSAAEAGIETAIQTGSGVADLSLGNQSSAAVTYNLLPVAGGAETIEYPPNWFKSDQIAQFWLINPDTTPLTQYYTNNSLKLYFGNPDQSVSADKPAVLVTIITRTEESLGNWVYQNDKHYIESDTTRAITNKFESPAASECTGNKTVDTTEKAGSIFYCEKTISIRQKSGGSPCSISGSPRCYPVMARVRLLYSSKPQKLALGPDGSCTSPCFPPQAQVFESTGTSGQSKKTIRVFRLKKYVPVWFDFSIFSAAAITK